MERIKKRDIDLMMKLSGNVKGTILKGHFDYIQDLKGSSGLKLVERRLEELGYPIKANEVDSVEWYSEALACLIVIIAAEVFNWEEKDVFKMAYEAPKYSFIVKILMQHFSKIERSFKMAPTYWRKNFDFSRMEVCDFNKKKGYGNIRLVDFHKYHPLICEYHRGYFTKIAEIMLGHKKVKVEHTKCLFRGDNYEEFKIVWR